MAADLKAKGGSAEDGDAVLTRLSQLLFSHDVGASNFGQRRVKMLEAQIGKLGASQVRNPVCVVIVLCMWKRS